MATPPLLFMLPRLLGPLKYTGIGARQTPGTVQGIMRDVAQLLGQRGVTLRSGHAAGADYALERGAAMAGGRGLPLQFGRNPLTHTKAERNFPDTMGSHLVQTDEDIVEVLRDFNRRDPGWIVDWAADHPAEYKRFVERGLLREAAQIPSSTNPQALAQGLDINLGGAKAKIPLAPAEDIAEKLWVIDKNTGQIKFPASPKTKLKAGEEIVDLSKTSTYTQKYSGEYSEGWAERGKFQGEKEGVTLPEGGYAPGSRYDHVPGGSKQSRVWYDSFPHAPYPQLAKTQHRSRPVAEGLEYGAAPGGTIHKSGPMEIYLPWSRFPGGGAQLGPSSSYHVTGMDPIARAFVRGELATDASGKLVRSRFMHPSAQPTRRPLPEVLEELENFGRMGPSPLPGNPLAVRNPQAVEALMSRNIHQLLGKDLMRPDPSDFLLAYTPGGQAVGGTGANLRAAQGLEMPILNLGGGVKAAERFERPNRMSGSQFDEMMELILQRLHGLDV